MPTPTPSITPTPTPTPTPVNVMLFVSEFDAITACNGGDFGAAVLVTLPEGGTFCDTYAIRCGAAGSSFYGGTELSIWLSDGVESRQFNLYNGIGDATAVDASCAACPVATPTPVYLSYIAERNDGQAYAYLGPYGGTFGTDDVVLADDPSGICLTS